MTSINIPARTSTVSNNVLSIVPLSLLTLLACTPPNQGNLPIRWEIWEFDCRDLGSVNVETITASDGSFISYVVRETIEPDPISFTYTITNTTPNIPTEIVNDAGAIELISFPQQQLSDVVINIASGDVYVPICPSIENGPNENTWYPRGRILLAYDDVINE